MYNVEPAVTRASKRNAAEVRLVLQQASGMATVLLDVNASASADVLAAWETKDYSKLSSILAKDGGKGGWFGWLVCDRGVMCKGLMQEEYSVLRG